MTIFQHIRSRRIHLSFRAETRLHLDRDLFLNLGRVQNLSLEISPPANLEPGAIHNRSYHSSGDLRRLGNPVTTYEPGHPRAVFLTRLRLSGNRWPCECDDGGIGWTEKWLRRWRGVTCDHRQEDVNKRECGDVLKDLRAASCQQYSDKSVLEALKTELECDAFSSASRFTAVLAVVITTLTVNMMIAIT